MSGVTFLIASIATELSRSAYWFSSVPPPTGRHRAQSSPPAAQALIEPEVRLFVQNQAAILVKSGGVKFARI